MSGINDILLSPVTLLNCSVKSPHADSFYYTIWSFTLKVTFLRRYEWYNQRPVWQKEGKFVSLTRSSNLIHATFKTMKDTFIIKATRWRVKFGHQLDSLLLVISQKKTFNFSYLITVGLSQQKLKTSCSSSQKANWRYLTDVICKIITVTRVLNGREGTVSSQMLTKIMLTVCV